MCPEDYRQPQARQGCSQELKGVAAHTGNYEFGGESDLSYRRSY